MFCIEHVNLTGDLEKYSSEDINAITLWSRASFCDATNKNSTSVFKFNPDDTDVSFGVYDIDTGIVKEYASLKILLNLISKEDLVGIYRINSIFCVADKVALSFLRYIAPVNTSCGCMYFNFLRAILGSKDAELVFNNDTIFVGGNYLTDSYCSLTCDVDFFKKKLVKYLMLTGSNVDVKF